MIFKYLILGDQIYVIPLNESFLNKYFLNVEPFRDQFIVYHIAKRRLNDKLLVSKNNFKNYIY